MSLGVFSNQFTRLLCAICIHIGSQIILHTFKASIDLGMTDAFSETPYPPLNTPYRFIETIKSPWAFRRTLDSRIIAP